MYRVASMGHGGKGGHGRRSRVKTPWVKGLADPPFSESPVFTHGICPVPANPTAQCWGWEWPTCPFQLDTGAAPELATFNSGSHSFPLVPKRTLSLHVSTYLCTYALMGVRVHAYVKVRRQPWTSVCPSLYTSSPPTGQEHTNSR